MPAPNTVADFWRQVCKTRGCWYWTGAGSKGDRYGRFGWKGKKIKAHRFAWSLKHGRIPHGIHILHHCDRGLCVRQRHLFSGSHRDNMLDMFRKGRRRILRGAQQGSAKLTAVKVRRMRRLYKRGGNRQVDLARQFGVSQTTTSRIVRGESWTHIQ